MMTLNDLVEIKPKRITYKDTSYYIKFSKEKRKDDLGNYKSYYSIVLFERMALYSPMVFMMPGESYEVADILQNYKISYSYNLKNIIEELKENNKDIENSPTYIQNIIMYFLEKYIKHKEEEVKYIVEKNEQLSNFEKWDGVISDDK